MQNEAARIVTGATKLISIANLLRKTVWEKETLATVFFYKMLNGLYHEYLSTLISSTVGNTVGIKHGFSCSNIRQVPWEFLCNNTE